MIDKALLTKTITNAIDGTDYFLVDVKVSPANEIVVEIDSPSGVDIDTCARLTRTIEAEFDRDVEDYELEVGSAGLTAPFKVKGQYDKNIGNQLEVLTRDGRKLYGTLTEVTAAEDGAISFTIEIPVKVKAPGAKRPTIEMQPETLVAADCKSVKYHFDFK
jgi:ribosome maturation factor RimP